MKLFLVRSVLLVRSAALENGEMEDRGYDFRFMQENTNMRVNS